MNAIESVTGFLFDRFELRLDDRQLLENGRPRALNPRAFDVLRVLLERSGRLTTKQDLLAKVWPDVHVEENSVQAQVSVLRKIIGSAAIDTDVGRGYRFALEVTCLRKLPPNNLPRSASSFIGRQHELGEVRALLRQNRLLSLVGTGGCGKTRICLEAVRDLRAYPDGVWFVELASLNDPNLIVRRLAGVLSVGEATGKELLQLVVERLADSRTLLVFDNAEHLIEGCAAVVEKVLSGSPGSSVMVTSRQPLGLPGEVIFRVPSLSVPSASETRLDTVLRSESAGLFVDRARLLEPGFTITSAEAAALTSICRRLDGIALAIELAAPRVRSMSLDEIDRRLDRRFSLLTSASSAALPRQRTLRSTIDWSYELLSIEEQTLLCRLSVFSGGWTMESAIVVCSGRGIEASTVAELLTQLVEKNLVAKDEATGAVRYRLLEMIRQYSGERIGEDRLAQVAQLDAHLAHFRSLGEKAFVEMTGKSQVAWFDRLDAEHDNFRAALSWSIGEGDDLDSGMTLAGSIWRFWRSRGFLDEGMSWATRLLAVDPNQKPSARLGNLLSCAGNMALHQADFSCARDFFQRSLAVREAITDRLSVGHSLNSLGMATGAMGDPASARRYFQSSLAIYEELGEQQAISTALVWLGNVNESTGDYAAALSMYERSLQIQQALGDEAGAAISQCNMGVVLGHQRLHVEAVRSFNDSLRRFHALRDVMWVGGVLEEMAPNLAALGHFTEAASIWGAADRLREVIGNSVMSSDRTRYQSNIASARSRCSDPVAFEHAFGAGHAMAWEDAVDFALSVRGAWD